MTTSFTFSVLCQSYQVCSKQRKSVENPLEVYFLQTYTTDRLLRVRGA